MRRVHEKNNIAINIIIAALFVLIFVGILVNDSQIPLSADIVTGNGSSESLAIDFLDWMYNADNNQVNKLTDIYVQGYNQANRPKVIDFNSTISIWKSIIDDINNSKSNITFKIKEESVLDHINYKDFNGRIISKEKYNVIKRKTQVDVEKEIDKEKVIERYDKSITPSNELVKRWSEVFDKVMEEADRRMPPVEKIYKTLTYIEYTLKDKTNIRIFIKQIDNKYYIDENTPPAKIVHESNPIGD